MELSQINLAELKQLQEQVEKEIARKEKQERQQAVEEIYRIAHNLNMPLAELLSKRPKKAANSTTYLDPNNPNNKWEGRGPRPAWLKRAIADGAKLEDFRAN